ncbi:MAG: histidine phosphatase family protein [Candidatus Delongbacteria bacterium]|nr:histidine phosphatase family protein [Candidatus Delongbacteria bacterium]MBN2833510.1 histidine phosphatase family protein [Candidatus Delongbacteria bacterium]
MILHLIRHAETDANRDGLLTCEKDISLNGNGKMQAIKLSKYLHSLNFDEIWCSPLLRAKQTIQSFVDHANFPIIYKPILCEGRLNLSSETKIRLSSLNENAIPNEDEAIEDFRGRVGFFIKILQSYDFNKTLVCITHGHFIREFLNMILESKNYARYPVENCSDTKIEFADNLIIHYVNKSTV